MDGAVRQVVLVLCVIVMLWTNLLDGADSNKMYSSYPTAFSPAPYAFAVWGLIFFGCIALAIYQALPGFRSDPRLAALAWPLTIAFLANALTPYTPIGWSNTVVGVLFIALAIAYVLAVRVDPQDAGFVWCVRVPLATFLGWVTVANILNGCQWAVSEGWTVGPVVAAVLIGASAAIGVGVVASVGEVAFAVVFAWAFWGIVAARPVSFPVVWAAVGGTVAMAGAIVWRFWPHATTPSG